MFFSFVPLVYDQIIGMVDATNLHIFGITVALAWQLPHRPDFYQPHVPKERIQSKVSNLNGTNENGEEQPSPLEDPKISENGNETLYHYDTYYNRKNYHSHKMDSSYYDYLKTKQEMDRPPLNKQSVFDDWNKYRTNKLRWNYSHDVYPALRMRRHIGHHNLMINGSNIHPDVKTSLEHHRKTRFDLYKSIEKYLNAYVQK